VDEDEIVAAMRMVWERMKIVIEPSAGVPVRKESPRFIVGGELTYFGRQAAVAMSSKFADIAGPDVKRIGVVLCGGNVDLDQVPWMLPKA
jgi:threonine dehydratase